MQVRDGVVNCVEESTYCYRRYGAHRINAWCSTYDDESACRSCVDVVHDNEGGRCEKLGGNYGWRRPDGYRSAWIEAVSTDYRVNGIYSAEAL